MRNKIRASPAALPWLRRCWSACLLAQKRRSTPAGLGHADNVTLTAEQRQQHPASTPLRPAGSTRAIDTTGTVDFDNDQATSVLAPMSGPVSRLLVSPGDTVSKGAALAVVDSPDLPPRSAPIARPRHRRRMPAGSPTGQGSAAHKGVSQREAEQAETDAANAEADRDAALQALISLDIDPQTIKDIQDGKPMARVEGMIRSPIAGTVVERLITPGQLLQAGTTPSFTVADLSQVWVMAQIFESDLGAVERRRHAPR